MFVYQADTYCDSCGHALREYLTDAGLAPLDPEGADSDEWPQEALEEATDGPDHCASSHECLEPIDLGAYGLALDAPLFGAESRLIGALLSDGLTEYGAGYLAEMLAEADPTPYQRALFALWRETFAEELTAV